MVIITKVKESEISVSNYKKKNLTAGQNYSAAPETIQFNGNASINVTATGYGLTVGSTGTRWYNTGVLPNGVLNGVNGQNTNLPFSNANMPTALYDAICRVDVGSEKFVYATSNSADNAVVTASNTNKEVFWLDLQSYGVGPGAGNLGSNSSANNFMAFGTPTSDNGGNNSVSIRFLNPTPAAATFSWTIEQFGAGPTISSDSGTFSIAAGVTSSIFLTDNYFRTYAPFSANLGVLGYYRIQMVPTNPVYQSMLNYYHYGIG
jgi:hypothetical protein